MGWEISVLPIGKEISCPGFSALPIFLAANGTAGATVEVTELRELHMRTAELLHYISLCVTVKTRIHSFLCVCVCEKVLQFEILHGGGLFV